MGWVTKTDPKSPRKEGDYPQHYTLTFSLTTMETITATLPTTIPYEDAHYKWNYDDCGVLCRFDKKTEAWEPMEPHCVDCGHQEDDCDCKDEAELCEVCGTSEEDNALYQGNNGLYAGKWCCRECCAKDDELDDELTYQQGWIDALLTQLTARPQTRATTKKIAELRQLRDQAQRLWGTTE